MAFREYRVDSIAAFPIGASEYNLKICDTLIIYVQKLRDLIN